MNHFTLLPSVNWNISHMLAINKDGSLCAYGSRGDIVIIKNADKDNLNEFESRFIARAHKNQRIMGLSFLDVEVDGQLVESLVSCGDDGRIKIWNIESESMTHKCLIKENSNTPMKLVDLDVFVQNNCVVSASENGSVVKWNVSLNKMWIYSIDPKNRSIINCIATCPHEEDLIAIGTRDRAVLIYSLKGEGKLRYLIRCHNSAVFSVSWCPVPYNILQLNKLRKNDDFDEEEWKKKDKTLLLASCSKDRKIYICRAGSDGYCEEVLNLPAKPVTNVSRYGNTPNTDRGRVIKWIYPWVLLTSTDFNEMVSVYMFPRNETKPDSKQVTVSNVKFEIKPLHNIHKRNISNFAVHIINSESIDFRVWSCGSDRSLVRSGYRKNYKENAITLPLLSGYIFCLDISPVNPDLLAIGTGDGKICIWDLSTDNYVDITTLSKRINNKIMSLRWHPLYEGVLAFGTSEGKVGTFDISQGNTTPTFFNLLHSKPIYKLCWAPAVGSSISAGAELHLFAVGNGNILQYDPSKRNEMPVSLNEEILVPIDEASNCKHKSDLCYDSERKLVAIGLSNGYVCICSAESFQLHHTITEQPKTIMSLAWHPKIVYEQPKEISPCNNWLATASAGESVFIYDVDPQGLRDPKKVASLEVHTNRVLCVSWSPHVNGRLLSCSADRTAIIWDVMNQTIIGRYIEHCADVLYGLWSPMNKDVVITGSADFTCRMWSISKDTVDRIVEPKKKKDKIIEPTVFTASGHKINEPASLNTSGLNDSISNDIASTSLTKISKTQTFLPTVAHEFPHSPLLENIFENAINKLNGICVENEKNLEEKSKAESEESKNSDDDVSEKGKTDSQMNEKVKYSRKSAEIRADCNYSLVFGTDDELIKLALHEERALENSGNLSEYFVLTQARYDLENKIQEAINKNQVTEQMLALAPAISPKLWRKACEVYIDQMINADNIFQAVNYQLALGEEDKAIELLCDKKRFKEAFTLARLRCIDYKVINSVSKDDSIGPKDDTVKNVVEKWIGYCYNSGLYRLGAHCYMYLDDQQNACTYLSKSKSLKDIILATKLLKYYQPKRATELALDCFKKHLLQLSAYDVEILFKEFPDIKFVEPWYVMLKYFKEETPSTAAITKWILGMQKEDKLPLVSDNADYDKLRTVITDNTFNMNYDQLMMYVSALAALYASGISHAEHKQSALKNYIRALSHCYSYKLINSNKEQSDAAYPMMRLLKLIFPAGLFNENLAFNSEADESTKMLYKSIKAFYCDFIFTWLVNCDDLPKSLKLLDKRSEENGDGDKAPNEVPIHDDILNVYKNRFVIIKDKKSKLQKIVDLLTLHIADVLDNSTISYFKESIELKKLENEVSSKVCSQRNAMDTNDEPGQLASNESEPSKSVPSMKKVENEKLNSSSANDNSENTSNVVDKIQNGVDENVQSIHKYKESHDAAKMKVLKELIDEFERLRVSTPNPFRFHCVAKDYLEKSRGIDDDLVSKLETLLNCNTI